MVALNKKDVSALYRKRARHYNFTANLYYLIGFREHAFRKKAVDALNLKKGDTVIERHPWESISKYLENTSFIELCKGVAYIAISEKAGSGGGEL